MGRVISPGCLAVVTAKFFSRRLPDQQVGKRLVDRLAREPATVEKRPNDGIPAPWRGADRFQIREPRSRDLIGVRRARLPLLACRLDDTLLGPDHGIGLETLAAVHTATAGRGGAGQW